MFFFLKNGISQPTADAHMGVRIYFPINVTASEVLPPNNRYFFYSLGAPNLVHLKWAKNRVRFRAIFRRDTISRYQSRNFGMWIQYVDISYIVISHDVGYDITIYRDISCEIKPDHLETLGKHKLNENPPPRCGLLLFFSALSLPSSWLVLGLAFFVVFRCPSAGHIIGLTVPPANSNVVPSRLSLLP